MRCRWTLHIFGSCTWLSNILLDGRSYNLDFVTRTWYLIMFHDFYQILIPFRSKHLFLSQAVRFFR